VRNENALEIDRGASGVGHDEHVTRHIHTTRTLEIEIL
jgi:hypothetical protein